MSDIAGADPRGTADLLSKPLPSIPWTSRAEVANALLAIAASDDPRAADATALLRVIASAAHAPRLLALALDRERPFWVRTAALRACEATRFEIPREALEALLDEQRSRLRPRAIDACRCGDCSSRGSTPDLRDVLCLARSDDAVSAVIALLEGASRELRAELLSAERLSVPRTPRPIVAWLERRWRDEVDDAALTAHDLFIARGSPDVPQVLLRHWASDPPDGDPWSELFRCPWLVKFLDDDTRRRAALSLALPLPELRERLGDGGLRRALRSTILAESLRRRCPLLGYPGRQERYLRARELLGSWSEGPVIALGLLRGAVLSPGVRADLIRVIAGPHRAAAQRILMARLGADEDRPALLSVLKTIAEAPMEGDRPLLRAALRLPDATVRCLVIDALDALGEHAREDGAGYVDILHALARSEDGVVRVRAALSLSRRGSGEHVAVLLDASRDPSAVVRASAVRALARLDDVAPHRAVFEAALRDFAEAGDQYHRPVAEQAALALGIAGGERSLGPLLEAYFALHSNPGRTAIEAAIKVILEDLDGRADSRDSRVARVTNADRGAASGWSPVRPFGGACEDE